ncbi:MAG: amino acid racemase [Chloroflexota bacterium]
MTKPTLNDIIFTENGPIDIEQFHSLHRIIGWDPQRQQTPQKTAEMMRLNHYHIAAHTSQGQLVGFARVAGDPYMAQVLDVITHPDYRNRGIATQCLMGVTAYLQQADYISVMLTDGSGLPSFYRRFGFELLEGPNLGRVWKSQSVLRDIDAPADRSLPAQSTAQSTSISPTPQSKMIGLLGGISHESTIQYYDLILKKYYALKGDYYYPRIVIHSLDFQRFTDFENNGDRLGYVNEIMTGVDSLEKAGVDFIVMTANSPHSVYYDVAKRTLLPIISIVDETMRYAKQHHLKSLLLTGIKYTMQADFYPQACLQTGITLHIPTDEEQDLIDNIIFDELVLGIFKPESKQILLDIIAQYPVDGVILGCTELPLIVKQDDLPIHAINTLDLHAEAALRFALE